MSSRGSDDQASARMRWAKGMALLVICIMTGFMANILIHDSMGHGVGLDTFLAGAVNPWQAFINQDLVSGLLLALTWIVFRQRGARVIDTVAWVWLVLWWGNIVVASYVLVATLQSQGDWVAFFMGRRSAVALRRVWPEPGIAVRALCLLAAAGCAAWLALAISASGFAPIATAGYLLGFAPILLALVLLAFPERSDAVVLA